jgi:hypothetical protein
VIEAEQTARRRYRERSRAYHSRHETKPDHHFANLGADGWVEDLEPADAPELVVEGAPAQRLTTSFIGLHTAQRGVNRGDIEAALSYLIDLAPEEADDAAA